jgi:HK97 family phage major capsid protein
MLDSVKISRRQSEIRQQLAELVAKVETSEDEIRSIEALDREYKANETKYRGALIAEAEERREAGRDLETREGSQWADLARRFEVRQAVLALAEEGRALTGATAEVVSELRSAGSFRGIPLPLECLEVRAGETVSSGVPDPLSTLPIVDRLFAPTAAARMGVAVVNIPAGAVEWPLTVSNVSGSWSASETGNVGGPTVFSTAERKLSPASTFGVQLRVTRRALLQTGAGLEAAIRRDLSSALTVGLDRAAVLGSGASGEPAGLIAGAAGYGIASTAIGAAASWSAFRAAIVAFIAASAATGPGDVRVMIRPEVWAALDGTLIAGTAVSELDRLLGAIGAGNLIVSTNGLAAPTGSPAASSALLTTSAGGLPPAWMGVWNGIDLIRDVYSDAQSGGVRLTGLVTADVSASRAVQSRVLTGLQ